MSKFIPQGELSSSPTTKSNHFVLSRIGSAIDRKTNKVIMGSYQVDSEDIVNALSILDQIVLTLQCTSELDKLREAMIKELCEVLEAVQDE
ncbi:MAG TPA: hypothetical protein VJ836_00695 [Candidatus Saccharimonadales bacterium]|nr:hypothetical protein [Candidatus Saccharimonadales bacterium]